MAYIKRNLISLIKRGRSVRIASCRRHTQGAQQFDLKGDFTIKIKFSLSPTRAN